MPAKAAVLVELGVSRPTDQPPVLDEKVNDRLGTQWRTWPCGHQATVQRDAGQHVEPDATDVVVLDDVEAVQLGVAGGDVGQVPGARRWRSPLARCAIEHAAAAQDTGDGPSRGHRPGPAGWR